MKVISAVIIGFLLALAGPAFAKPIAEKMVFCSDPKINEVVQNVRLHKNAASNMVQARSENVAEVRAILSASKRTAIGASVMFVISAVLLAGALFRRIMPPGAIRVFGTVFFAHFWFAVAVLFVMHSQRGLGDFLDPLRKTMAPPQFSVNLEEGTSGDRIAQQALQAVHQMRDETTRAVANFKRLTGDMPEERWWVLGWDSVQLVEAELLGAKGLRDRFHQHAEIADQYLLKLSKNCSERESI